MEEKNLHVEEGALKVTKLTLYEAVAIIVGANVGSGILGLAYSSRLAGWPILVLWLAVAGLFTTFSMLYVAESALRTKKPLQLPGLAEKYVGKVGSVLIFISVCANSIGCMVSPTGRAACCSPFPVCWSSGSASKPPAFGRNSCPRAWSCCSASL